MIKREDLKDWENADKVGTRFPVFKQPEKIKLTCPACGTMELLEDTWPPNYFYSGFGGGYDSLMVDIKLVCLACRLHIEGRYERRVIERETLEYEVEIVLEGVPLVKRDGKWLTPHDVWREEYKAEHGDYPLEAYG